MSLQQSTAPLSPEWYVQPDYLDRERERIFQRNWIFAGLKQDLANPNDYISFTIAGIPIIVRHMREKLVAFYNICSHRHALIHPRGEGNSPFRCCFHGWTFDDEGVPVSIPDNTRSFGFDKDDRRALALHKIEVDICGNFVFVRLEPGGAPLATWLGAFREKLEHMSLAFDHIYNRLSLQWACNWKFGIEVTLEGYHLPFVHPSSFAQYIESMPQSPLSASAYENAPYGHTGYSGSHISNDSPLSRKACEWIADRASQGGIPFKAETGSYEHFLIYPNFMASLSNGVTLCVERYEPVAPDKTEVQCWLMTETPRPVTGAALDRQQEVFREFSEWTVSVIDEDRAACESVQLGVVHAQRNGFLGQAEERVRHLQSSLLQNIKDTDKD